jgi:hypothetical protein
VVAEVKRKPHRDDSARDKRERMHQENALDDRRHIGHDAPIELITAHVRQIEVKRTEIAISLPGQDHATDDGNDNPFVSSPCRGTRHLTDAIATSLFPKIRHEHRFFGSALTPGQSSSPQLRVDGSGSPRSRSAPRQSTASRDVCSKRLVNDDLAAFLAPSLVKAVEGRLPHGSASPS